MGAPAANDDRPPSGIRPTEVGRFSLSQPGKSGARTVPVPWVDCSVCSWRHYPSTEAGRWHIATTCTSCGAELVDPVAGSSAADSA